MQRMIEFAVSYETFVFMLLSCVAPAKCGRVFVLGLAACGFESPSLPRLLNEIRFCVFKSSSSHLHGCRGKTTSCNLVT